MYKLVKDYKSIASSVRNTFNNRDIDKFLSAGRDALKAIEPYMTKPTKINLAIAFVGVSKAIGTAYLELWSDQYFHDLGYVKLCSNDSINSTIVTILREMSYETLICADKQTTIQIITIDGVEFGWTYEKQEHLDYDIMVSYEKLEKAKKIVKDLLWKKFNNSPIVLKKVIVEAQNKKAKIEFEVDTAYEGLPSKKSIEYSEYLARCINAGVKRSVMLYGPPGTGKSTLTRALVDRLNIRPLRIRVEDIKDIDNSLMSEIISFFEPGAVILDDIDRATIEQVTLLETLEYFQKHVKLVVATANNIKKLDPAILRPGRFDELVYIDKMDDNVIKHILGEYVDGYEIVKKWPIAYIREYVKRRQFMTPAEAEKSIKSLASRIKQLSEQDGEIDEEGNPALDSVIE